MQTNSEIWLSVDLSWSVGTLALFSVTDHHLALLHEDIVSESGNHSENFLPRLDKLLSNSKIGLNQITRFVSSSGPGSFTGLRIALSSLKALAISNGCHLELISSSEARARSWQKLNPENKKEIVIVTRVAAQTFCVARYNPSNHLFTEDIAVAKEVLEQYKGSVVLVDVEKTKELFPTSHLHAVNAKSLAENLLEAHTRQTFHTLEEISQATPNYFGSTRF